jgi:Peptidase family M28
MSPSQSPPYQFVDVVAPATGAARVSPNAIAVARSLEVAALEPDVRYLASPALRGRLRGTEGNARARQHIIGRLRAAGLAPLFGGDFEQPTYPRGPDQRPYAVNVGAIYRAAEPDAGWVALVAHYDHRGVIGGAVHPGADDNASAVALLLALGHSLGRERPSLRRHVVLLFPDAEEPPDIRTKRMGSSWFWRNPPLPIHRLHLALVFDLMGGRATPELRAAGLGQALFVLGAEADPSLVALVHGLEPVAGVEPIRLSLAMIEAMPYRPGSRFARSDYHGLREHQRRPFLFLTTGRTETYHTAADTPDTLDYARLGDTARWVARLAVHAADIEGELGWHDRRADALTDARSLLRLYGAIDADTRVAWLLRRALAADRRRVEQLLAQWQHGTRPTNAAYRTLLLASIRAQAALWHPSGWWFALW